MVVEVVMVVEMVEMVVVFVNIFIEGIWTARKLTSNVCGWKTGATRF